MPEKNFLTEVMRFSAGDYAIYTSRSGHESVGKVGAVYKPSGHLNYALIKFIPAKQPPYHVGMDDWELDVWTDLNSQRCRPATEEEYNDAKTT